LNTMTRPARKHLSIGWAMLACAMAGLVAFQANSIGGFGHLGWPAGLEALLAFLSLVISRGLWTGHTDVHVLVRWTSFFLLLLLWPAVVILMFLSPIFSLPFILVLVLAHASRSALAEA